MLVCGCRILLSNSSIISRFFFFFLVLFSETVQILTVIKTAKKYNIFLLITQCISVAMVLTDFDNHQINAPCAGEKKIHFVLFLLLFIFLHNIALRCALKKPVC